MFNYFLNLKKIRDVNALVSFSFGEYSKTTETMSDEEIISEIMKHLKTMYGNHIPNPSKILRTNWNSNPYAFGAYSFTPKNASSASFKVFEQAIANKLFFAGEHTSQDYRGTVHGAYLSGIREAKKMLEN
jgi:monoamine oxidase